MLELPRHSRLPHVIWIGGQACRGLIFTPPKEDFSPTCQDNARHKIAMNGQAMKGQVRQPSRFIYGSDLEGCK
ncbi:MAG: hypothetical protein KJ666_01060 [Bacteroidetes bacterium]|nr:hypothetical protein [Bacteroidota bacterium]